MPQRCAHGQAKEAGVPEEAVREARRAESKDARVAAVLRFVVRPGTEFLQILARVFKKRLRDAARIWIP